jgi:hypothetical protein
MALPAAITNDQRLTVAMPIEAMPEDRQTLKRLAKFLDAPKIFLRGSRRLCRSRPRIFLQ